MAVARPAAPRSLELEKSDARYKLLRAAVVIAIPMARSALRAGEPRDCV
jgi:hypothetical protein